MKIFNDSKGYSLLELLVVIAIIAILAGISIPVFQGQVEKAKETADISNLRTAYELAITGHLVISTIHTERALDVIERLRDLGIADYLIKSALRGVISQRLLRRSSNSAWSTKISLNSEAVLKNFGVPGTEEYSGRVGVFELLRVTPDLVRMKQHEIEDKVIYDYIRKTQSDYTDIYENTYSLIRQGVTTLEEAGRVLDSNILKVYNINRKSGLT